MHKIFDIAAKLFVHIARRPGAALCGERAVGRLLCPMGCQVGCKGFLKGSVLCGGNSAVICEIILTNLAIGVDLASEVALVGSILVANEYDVARVLYHSANITTNTMVHILPLCDNVLTTLGKNHHIIAISKLKGGL